eukprot:scaffold13809_cov22-Cyclotella_meneghiniana.AAC.3
MTSHDNAHDKLTTPHDNAHDTLRQTHDSSRQCSRHTTTGVLKCPDSSRHTHDKLTTVACLSLTTTYHRISQLPP